TFVERPFYQMDVPGRDEQMYTRVYSVTKEPARRAGEMTGYMDFLDPTSRPRRAWSYTPGQRRVKLAPEFAYDTPVASMGGIELFDELFMFSGMQDRFDFKLVGKKEMYIPYNNYELYFDCNADTQLMASHLNPECERWELHRVWEVEATLKEGRRHVYSKRTYYLDEDTYGAGLYDAWDQSGQLYRSMMLGGVQLYDHDIPYIVKHVSYDFNRGMYGLINDALAGGYKVLESPRSERELNPEAIVSRESVRYPKQLWCGPQGERYREQLSPSGDAVPTQDASGLLRVRIMTISCWLESSPSKRSISLAVACFLYLGLGS